MGYTEGVVGRGDLARAMAREQTHSMQEEYEKDDGYYAD
jgi:hypothetical protein